MHVMPLAISPVTLAIQAQKSPSSKLRNPPPWLHPRQIERSYAVMLQRLTKEFTRQVRDIVIPALASISEQADTELGLAESARLDAWSDRVEELMSILRIGATKREKSVDALAVDIGQRTSNWNNKEWQKILRRTVGVSLLQSEPGLRERLRLFVETNTKLIGNMQTQGIEKINGIIERGFSTGARHTTVAADIETALGVEENKARLTARDQVSKLNGRLTQMRQVEAGIPHYIWQTAEDIRVRTSHRVMDGKLARWDDATLYAEVSEPTVWKSRSGISAVELHPGEDVQCRCFGEPFIRELEREEEAA